MIRGWLNLPWFVWAALAFLISVIYSFALPHQAATATTGFRFFVLRWGHALTWSLLTINFILRGIDSSLNGLASFCALVAGLMYLLFLVMTFVVK
jgi:hypothetical protein